MLASGHEQHSQLYPWCCDLSMFSYLSTSPTSLKNKPPSHQINIDLNCANCSFDSYSHNFGLLGGVQYNKPDVTVIDITLKEQLAHQDRLK